ncbi:MAG TPA: DUF6484 domain-containing protein [Steroidobacteraceae bacterium]
MRKKGMNTALLAAHGGETSSAANATGAAQVGTLVALNTDGSLAVQVPGTLSGPTPARLAVTLTTERLQAAVQNRQAVVLVFENGDRGLPIVVGLLETAARPVAGDDADTARKTAPPIIEADVDGRRVRVTAQDEIVLQCGSASVTLRRNGRIVIRGSYVETHSEGTNRIKGGQVQIN